MTPIATDHLKICTERIRLLDLMNDATKYYARAATDLARKMGKMAEAEYKRGLAEVEQARLDAEHAREALVQHMREHGC